MGLKYSFYFSLYPALIICSVGIIAVLVAYFVGAAKPYLSSILIQLAFLFPMGIGGSIFALAIYGAATLIKIQGSEANPDVQALSSAIVGIIGLLAENFTSLSKYMKPAFIASVLMKLRYDKQFPKLSSTEPDSVEFREAYSALNRDPIADNQGQISGWGFSSCQRRLKLIQRGVVANNSTSCN